MTVTVLGARGFVGRRLAARLAAADQTPWTPERGDPEVLRRDLGVVYYCVGLTADYDRRPFDTVEAHASLFSEILRAGRFERIVYCSSTRLYDGAARPEVDEATPLVFDPADPRRVYDLSKALGENLALTRAAGRGVVARLANVFDDADGSPGFLSEWLIRARASRELVLESSPYINRDYIQLDDAVAALIAITDGVGIYNVASGALVSNAEIADVFREAGWAVTFTGQTDPPPSPNASVERLAGLGMRARPVKDVVRAYLEGLKA